ncbi:DUF1190 domain-containing protein [Dyella marensis]|jgi:uncharacterized protein YgiB involved in biofilm formation|uniref:Uncharacterized conserved protein YgiB, involved in bioifilm formation, UPF0441/DUF1190 family n=1 Tax=Dyella marensis TaxID=500610 RepID=A0A1I2HWE2_9GAMM|nr:MULTISPECIES: DUF1190 domain-containing protein [Dyella]SFF33057.1 Uncharacterized conserved protein YgiB, involved in bioifilm formation, UPF0441/DUF1190 family [Dyella marensis]
MKRSRTAALLLMGSLPLCLTACGDDEATREGLYTSVDACVAQTQDRPTCEQAFANAASEAAEKGPHFDTRAQCAASYDWDRCEERRDSGGHSFFGPLMTGFFLSQMLRNGSPMTGFTAGPAFRDTRGQWGRPDPAAGPGPAYGSSSRWRNSGTAGTGGYYGSSARGSSGLVPVSSTPDRAVTVSRGGFGSSFRGRIGS